MKRTIIELKKRHLRVDPTWTSTEPMNYLLSFFVGNGLVLLSSVVAVAQLQITFPTTRAVFQRDRLNGANVPISGAYSVPVDKVEARFVPRQAGQGTETNWAVIQENPQGGNFLGSVNVKGGWYNLEVRASYQGTFLPSVTMERVGVGEVFVIAGQSNAQGLDYIPFPESQDDRINFINDRNGTPPPNSFSGSLADPKFPTFSRLTNQTDLAPRGQTAWCWGVLGDQIAQRYNVPVLFLNAGWEASRIKNWRESAEGLPTINIFCANCPDDQGKYYPSGFPYGNLKIALTYYASLLGVRAVLWHQGETDAAPLETSTDEYREDLRRVIEISRNDLGSNLSWVVSRVSRTFKDGQYIAPERITIAQTQVIEQVPNVFAGPNTDDIQVPRPFDNVHFGSDGLRELALAWFNSLNDNFFSNSQPVAAAGLVPVSASCAGDNVLRLSVAGRPAYGWSDGQSGTEVVVGSGVYVGKFKDGNRTLFSQPYRVPDRPVFKSSGPILENGTVAPVCENSKITLSVANYAQNLTWSTGANTPSIETSGAGQFTVSYRDFNGCTFTSERPLQVRLNPLPPRPTVQASGPTTFCRGETRVLTSSTPGISFLWSTNETSRSIVVGETGVFAVQAIDGNGCVSPRSNALITTANPVPPKPNIITNGPTTFCADRTVTLTATISDSTYLWNDGTRSSSLVTNRAGAYSVRTINRFGCASVPADSVRIRVNALPPKPTLIPGGPTSFCDRQAVNLCGATSGLSGAIFVNNDNSLVSPATCYTARTSGNYFVKVTDANGCENRSERVTVTVKALPTTPTIAKVGTYTLEAQGALPGETYFWQVNGNALRDSLGIIKARREGTYTAYTQLSYDVPGPSPRITCVSESSDPYEFFYDLGISGGLSIYPNPNTTGWLNIETQKDWVGAEITVHTLEGKLIYSGRVTAFDEWKRIDLGRTAGQFLVRVRADGFEVTKRVVVLSIP
jgi:hypothetical protein